MSGSSKHVLISVVGPTAVGKTDFAIRLAQHYATEILSVDSRQFFKELNIGTAKPSKEELGLVTHHFINSHSVTQYISAGLFEKESISLLDRLFTEHDKIVAVGGSGLYFKALWEGMDEMPKAKPSLREELNKELKRKGLNHLLEELKAKDEAYFHEVDQQNHQRVIRALEVIRSSGKPFSSFRGNKDAVSRSFRNIKIGLEMDRKELYDRIDQRMDNMIKLGLFEEAEEFYPFKNEYALQTVGYTEIFNFLDGEYDKDEAIRLLKRNSRRYAKRQMTWFKKDPDILWIHPKELKKAIDYIESNT